MSVKGTYFGDYLLLAKLAKGGMAQVCVGKRFGAEGFERLVAIKQLLPEFSKDDKFVTMFIDEAKIASQLNHANICQIYDLGKKDDTLFIAMEYIHGRDIYSILKRLASCRQLMPANLAAAAIAKIADALDYAHRKKDQNGQPLGIVHRDVSPQNILISFEGDVKLIDFGIAKAKDRAAKTQAGIIKGKFFYMSPEQITDKEIDGRTDIFALGAVLYEILTGVPAFKGANDVETIRNVATCHYLPVSHYNSRCPKALSAIVDKAMAPNRDLRYQRAAEMSADLQRYLLNEAEPVSGQDFSEFLTQLFSGEWTEEKEKIRYFRSVKAPAKDEADEDICSLEKTVIGVSLDSVSGAHGSGRSRHPSSSGQYAVKVDARSVDAATGYKPRVVSAAQLMVPVAQPPSSEAYQATQIITSFDPNVTAIEPGHRQLHHQGRNNKTAVVVICSLASLLLLLIAVFLYIMRGN